MTKNFESRNTPEVCRALSQDGKRYIEGYALLYNHRSKPLNENGKWFYEIIKPGALDKVLNKPNLDVIATPNHTYSQILGRTSSNTLQLINDLKGLRYKIEVPDTSYGNDIWQSIKRGDTFESSFTFYVSEAGQIWTKDQDGNQIRTITEIQSLREVGPVTWGAYSDTAVNARDHQKKGKGNIDYYRLRLSLARLRSGIEPKKMNLRQVRQTLLRLRAKSL